MGEASDGANQPGQLSGHLSHLIWDTFAAYIEDTYRLANESDIWFLIEELDGIVMRDQRPVPALFATAEAQRKSAHTAAKGIVSGARLAKDGLQKLEKALSDFGASIGGDFWSAAMLEEAFDIPYVDPHAVEPPEVFDPVRAFFTLHTGALAEIRADLDALAALPVKSRLRKNIVRNHVLRQGLEACRAFWEKHGSTSWSRSSLSYLGPAGSNQTSELNGPCERFVVDMFTAAQIQFSLKTLNGAWSAFDKAAPPAKGTSQAKRSPLSKQ